LPAISADGRFVAFMSEASNLIPDKTNHARDVFLVDRLTRTTTRVSVGDHGEELAAGAWDRVSMSRDGCRIGFAVIEGVRLYDCRSGTSTPIGFALAPQGSDVAVSGDGEWIGFTAYSGPGDTNQYDDVFRFDVRSGRIGLVTRSAARGATNGQSVLPSLSADGSVIAFGSQASNLIGDDTNDQADVFVVRPLDAGACDDADACTTDRHASSGCRHEPLVDYDGIGCALDNLRTQCGSVVRGVDVGRLADRIGRAARRASDAHAQGSRRKSLAALRHVDQLLRHASTRVRVGRRSQPGGPTCVRALIDTLREIEERVRRVRRTNAG
jgi:hypothetical protein